LIPSTQGVLSNKMLPREQWLKLTK